MWEKINKFTHSHTILAAFLIGTFFISVLSVFAVFIMYLEGMADAMDTANPAFLIYFTMVQIALWIIAIWLMRKMQVFNINDFKFKNMGKGFFLGWFNIVFAVGAFFSIFMQIPEGGWITPDPVNLLITVLHPFVGTGMFEEILVRGLILKILLLTMGHSKKGIINACIISSAIFGFAHIVNLIHGTELLSIATQIVYATFIGVFYAALFLRTKTLWVPILLHGLTNVSLQIFNAIVSPDIMQGQAAEDAVGGVLNILLLTLPFLIAGFILLRKVTPEDVELLMVEREG